MTNEELKVKKIWESLNSLGNPTHTVYECDDYVVNITDNVVSVIYRPGPCGSRNYEIDHNKIRKMYHEQGDKITVKDILENIKEQFKVYE